VIFGIWGLGLVDIWRFFWKKIEDTDKVISRYKAYFTSFRRNIMLLISS
jgi:hypothetical protein